MKLTKEQKEMYLTRRGVKCPVCGSEVVEGGLDIDLDGSELRQGARCRECDSEWVDVYTLTGIEDVEEDHEH
jgi:predicted Zn-ribbon and HTH transcriptional regulator